MFWSESAIVTQGFHYLFSGVALCARIYLAYFGLGLLKDVSHAFLPQLLRFFFLRATHDSKQPKKNSLLNCLLGGLGLERSFARSASSEVVTTAWAQNYDNETPILSFFFRNGQFSRDQDFGSSFFCLIGKTVFEFVLNQPHSRK